jgi:hypothetical protein
MRAGAFQGAYYLAGYAVECALKACIAQEFRQHDIPDKKLVNDVYTHDVNKLLDLAGLRPTLRQDAVAHPALQTNWNVATDWKETAGYDPESDRWRFVVASPEVRLRDPHAAYRKIEALARRVPGAATIFAPGDLSVVKDNDPLVVLLRKAISTGPGIGGIRFTNNSINATFIDEAYIYRLPPLMRGSNFRVNPPGETSAVTRRVGRTD